MSNNTGNYSSTLSKSYKVQQKNRNPGFYSVLFFITAGSAIVAFLFSFQAAEGLGDDGAPYIAASAASSIIVIVVAAKIYSDLKSLIEIQDYLSNRQDKLFHRQEKIVAAIQNFTNPNKDNTNV